MISPDAIPRIDGDMAALTAHADILARTGPAIADIGERVHRTWQELATVYVAPEAGDLLAATGPVMTVTASMGEDIGGVAMALRTYATDTAIQARLEQLRAAAVSLGVAYADAQDESTTVTLDGRSVEITVAVNEQVAEWEAAQLRCANAIRALTGAPPMSSYTSAMTLVDPGNLTQVTPRAPTGPLREVFPVDPAPPISSTGNPPVVLGPGLLVNVPAPPTPGIVDGPGSVTPPFGPGFYVDKASLLPRTARLKLGTLLGRADETVADLIRERGGGAKQVGQLRSGYGDLTLGEAARRAVEGDIEAERAVKMVKQAGTEGKGGK